MYCILIVIKAKFFFQWPQPTEMFFKKIVLQFYVQGSMKSLYWFYVVII